MTAATTAIYSAAALAVSIAPRASSVMASIHRQSLVYPVRPQGQVSLRHSRSLAPIVRRLPRVSA